MSDYWINASEVAEYVYCQRAWWLRHVVEVDAAPTEAMDAGARYHAAHQSAVQQRSIAQWLAYLCVVLAVALVVFWLVSAELTPLP